MTTPVKLTTFSGQERTATSNPYITRLTLKGKTHYSCNFCKINFLNIAPCIRHIRTHTGENPFSCSYCNHSFSRKYSAQVHKNIHTGEKPFRCEACGLSFSSGSHLHYHRKQKKNIACSASRSKVTGSNSSSTTTTNLKARSVQRRQISTKNNFGTVETKTTIVKPVKVQTGDKPYTCKYSYCKKAFSLKGNAKAHEKTHLGVNLFHCNVCRKGFRSPGGLKYHLTKSKISKCSTFVIRSAAVQITKPVRTKLSTTSQIKQRSQEGQDQSVHTSTARNLIQQKVDGKVFHCQKNSKRRNSAFEYANTHIRGKRFSCTHSKCNKSYSREGDLRRHQKTHSGKLRFTCNFCQRQFPSNFNCVQHIRSHTGMKPFPCSYCSQTFSQKGNAKTHERKIHQPPKHDVGSANSSSSPCRVNGKLPE